MTHKVLVLGGSGLVGKSLQKVRPDWEYFGSSMGDLRNFKEVFEMLKFVKPDAVINLAARVGGIRQNIMRQGEFLYDNCMIGMNVIEACRKASVTRLLTSLSTCAWPDTVSKYPMKESDLHEGPPTPTNISYGYSKRLLHVATCAYRDQYDLNYSTFAPSNVYGPEDTFDDLTSHFVPACMRKFHNKKRGEVILWGSGKPKRQQLFVDDLARAIPIILDRHNDKSPLIVAPDENLSIDSMANTIKRITKSNASIVYNQEMEGQIRKDGCNKLFKELCGGFNFTPFYDGAQRTYDWFMREKA